MKRLPGLIENRLDLRVERAVDERARSLIPIAETCFRLRRPRSRPPRTVSVSTDGTQGGSTSRMTTPGWDDGDRGPVGGTTTGVPQEERLAARASVHLAKGPPIEVVPQEDRLAGRSAPALEGGRSAPLADDL